MSAERAAELAGEAVKRIGLERFDDSRRGPAILADLVGGADADLYRWSSALEVACSAWADRDTDAITESELHDSIRQQLSDEDDAAWAASTWRELVVPNVAPAPDPGSRVELDEPAYEPYDEAELEWNLIPILVVALLVMLLVLALFLAG